MLLCDLKENETFIMPWRPKGVQAGKLIAVGIGGAQVHIPRVEGDGWEYTYISRDTEVVPCSPEFYHQQGFGASGGTSRVMNKSTVRKPVDVVHELCDDMIGIGEADVDFRNKVVAAAVELGVNENTAKTQFYAWKKKKNW